MATRKALGAAVETRLDTIPNVAGYRGEVEDTPPTLSVNDPRVRPYWVLHTSAGRPNDERITGDLAGVAWAFQVTAAAGRATDLDQLVDAIIQLLSGWRPFPECSRCWMDQDFIPGPAQRDDEPTPARFWTPLVFKIHT